MATPLQTSAAPRQVVLTGVEKVVVLLLALGKQHAAKLLKRFDVDELKLLTRSAADLRSINEDELEVLVEEFAQKFGNGVTFAGTPQEIRDLLGGIMSDDEISEILSPTKQQGAPEEPIWDRISSIKLETLRAYLIKEHPQCVALVLSKIASEAAAKLISSFPPNLRSGLLSRMLAIKSIADDTLGVFEGVLREDLLAPTGSGSYAGIAEILNRLDKAQSEDVLKSLAEVRPADAKALKDLLFTFEDLATLPAKARTVFFDLIPIERLVLALRGTEPEFQSTILSSLASRSRRMVEAELQGASTTSPREIADARRSIVELVLKMIAKGEIELAQPDAVDDITH